MRSINFAMNLKAIEEFPVKTAIKNKAALSDRFHSKIIRDASTSLSSFDGAEFEAFIASHYRVRSGIPVAALLADATSGRMPDFELEFERQPVFVECKARVSLSPQQKKIEYARKQVMNSLYPILEGTQFCYGIRVATSTEPNPEDCQDVIKELRRLVQTGVSFEVKCGPYSLVGRILAPRGSDHRLPRGCEEFGTNREILGLSAAKRFIREFEFEIGKHYRSFVAAGSRLVRKGLVSYIDPRFAVVDFLVVPYHVSAVREMVRRARHQFVKGARNVVFINAPDFYNEQFGELERMLKGTLMSGTTVSAVVLWHRVNEERIGKYDRQLFDLKYQHISMRNARALNPLPMQFFESTLPPSNIYVDPGRGDTVLIGEPPPEGYTRGRSVNLS